MVERQTAFICTLKELKDGSWVEQAERPSGVSTPRGVLSKVNVLGVIVEMSAGQLVLDDGTARLVVRAFDAPLRGKPGDLAVIVGRPREYNGERYIALGICKVLANKLWAEYRKRELAHVRPTVQTPVRANVIVAEVPATGTNKFDLLLTRIRELDDGKGADIQELLAGVNHPEKDRLLTALLEEGEIFEIRPGRVKVLE